MLTAVIFATGDFAELFQELIYGNGAWIGFLIVIGLAFLITTSVKYASLPMAFLLVFYGLHVLANAADPSNILYGVLITFISIPFLGLIEWKRKR